MRLFSIAAFAAPLALTLVPPASVREFRIDAGHSDIAFSIGFLGLPVRGRFSDIRGIIAYAAGNPSGSAVTVVIGAKSIATGSDHRDEHLRSADFFDVARYPTIVFRSDSITQHRESLMASGALTMHGVTKRVVIPFREISKPIADPHGSTLTRLRAQPRDSLAGLRWDIGMVARGLLEHGKTADALALFRFVAETWPDDPDAHSALARAFELSNAPDSARAQTRRALALDPLDPRALEIARRIGR